MYYMYLSIYIHIHTHIYILDGKRCAITVQQRSNNNSRGSSSIWQLLLSVFWSRSGFCIGCFHWQNIRYMDISMHRYTPCYLLKNALDSNCFVLNELKRNYIQHIIFSISKEYYIVLWDTSLHYLKNIYIKFSLCTQCNINLSITLKLKKDFKYFISITIFTFFERFSLSASYLICHALSAAPTQRR